MDNLLQEILGLLRNNHCAYDEVSRRLKNLIETIEIGLHGNISVIQYAQLQSLTNFPTTIQELLDLIVNAIRASGCDKIEKNDMLVLLSDFTKLAADYKESKSQ